MVAVSDAILKCGYGVERLISFLEDPMQANWIDDTKDEADITGVVYKLGDQQLYTV